MSKPESPLLTLLILVVRIVLFVAFGIPGLIGAWHGILLMTSGNMDTLFPGYLLFCLSMPFATIGCGAPMVGGSAV